MKKFFIVFCLAVFLTGCGSGGQQGSDSGTSVKGDISKPVCEEFNADFIYSATQRTVVKVEPDWILPDQACRYYFTYDPNLNPQFSDPILRGGGQFIFMMIEDLSVENQKKGITFLEATYTADNRIPMENMVVYRKDKTLRDIRLIINPNRYLRIEGNLSKLGIKEEEFFA